MSPTSTDRGGTAFRRALTTVVVALLVLCGTFFALDWFQGPKLVGAQIDPAAAAAAPGQQLRLFVDQPLAGMTADQVTVTPPTPVTVSATGSIIAVQFDERLDYATEYRVMVAEATGAQHTIPSTLEHRFTTPAASVHYLERADPARGGPDSIIRTGIGSEPSQVAKEVVYTAERIQDFAVVGDALVVVTMAADHTGTITLVSLTDGSREQLRMPEPGTIERLRSSPDHGILGFVFTAADGDPSSGLMLVDLNGSHAVTAAPALDGTALEVLEWMFLPGSSRFVAQTLDRSLVVFDTAQTGPPVPVGTYRELDGVSPDGSALLVKDVFGSIVLSLADGSETRITPSPLDGETPYSSTPALLPDGRSTIQSIVLLSADLTSSQSFLVVDDGTEARVVYTPPPSGAIDGFALSPNGQYVAVAVVPDVGASSSDGYYPFAKATSIMTLVVDLTTGEQVRSYAGFGTIWP